MSSKLFQIAIISTILIGCKDNTAVEKLTAAPNFLIKGQVFVIQKNRLNVKLGGVDVYYIPLEEFRKRCKWIESQRARALEVKNYKERMNQIDNWLIDLGAAPSATKLQTFLSAASQLQTNAQNRFKANPEVIEFQRIEDLRKSNSELFEASEISSNESCQWIATCLFFDWADRTADRESKTDADGNFTLTIPKSAPGIIMMNSSRQLVGGGFENYYWLKEISGNEIDPLIFSSKDTVTGGFLMETVRQASEPPRSSMKIIQSEMGLVDLEWFSEALPIYKSISGGDKQIETLQHQIQKLEQSIQDIRYASEP